MSIKTGYSDVSIIVPVYQQWENIPEIIRVVTSHPQKNLNKLVFVDNGSDEIPELLAPTNVEITACSKPGSYAARNVGIEQINSELIIFTDADCIPDENWVSNILGAYVQSDRKTLLAGHVIIRSDSDKPSTSELYDLVAGLPQERYVSQGYAVTANLAIPRVVFDEIGLFDDQRFSGGDAEFCQRAIKAGFSLKYISEAVVYHPARKTWDEYATKVRRMKGGQIRAGSLKKRIKCALLTLLPPVWRFCRTCRSNKLTTVQKFRVVIFQVRLWLVELAEMFVLICGKTPERR